MTHKLIKTDNYLLVVDKSEIKEGDWIKWDSKVRRAVDTAYLPSTKKIIAHLPINSSPILEGVDLLPPCSDSPKYFECQVGVCSRWLDEDCDKDCCGIPEKNITITTAQGVQWVGKYL
jgi:hypothetical protein